MKKFFARVTRKVSDNYSRLNAPKRSKSSSLVTEPVKVTEPTQVNRHCSCYSLDSGVLADTRSNCSSVVERAAAPAGIDSCTDCPPVELDLGRDLAKVFASCPDLEWLATALSAEFDCSRSRNVSHDSASVSCSQAASTAPSLGSTSGSCRPRESVFSSTENVQNQCASAIGAELGDQCVLDKDHIGDASLDGNQRMCDIVLSAGDGIITGDHLCSDSKESVASPILLSNDAVTCEGSNFVSVVPIATTPLVSSSSCNKSVSTVAMSAAGEVMVACDVLGTMQLNVSSGESSHTIPLSHDATVSADQERRSVYCHLSSSFSKSSADLTPIVNNPVPEPLIYTSTPEYIDMKTTCAEGHNRKIANDFHVEHSVDNESSYSCFSNIDGSTSEITETDPTNEWTSVAQERTRNQSVEVDETLKCESVSPLFDAALFSKSVKILHNKSIPDVVEQCSKSYPIFVENERIHGSRKPICDDPSVLNHFDLKLNSHEASFLHGNAEVSSKKNLSDMSENKILRNSLLNLSPKIIQDNSENPIDKSENPISSEQSLDSSRSGYIENNNPTRSVQYCEKLTKSHKTASSIPTVCKSNLPSRSSWQSANFTRRSNANTVEKPKPLRASNNLLVSSSTKTVSDATKTVNRAVSKSSGAMGFSTPFSRPERSPPADPSRATVSSAASKTATNSDSLCRIVSVVRKTNPGSPMSAASTSSIADASISPRNEVRESCAPKKFDVTPVNSSKSTTEVSHASLLRRQSTSSSVSSMSSRQAVTKSTQLPRQSAPNKQSVSSRLSYVSKSSQTRSTASPHSTSVKLLSSRLPGSLNTSHMPPRQPRSTKSAISAKSASLPVNSA